MIRGCFSSNDMSVDNVRPPTLNNPSLSRNGANYHSGLYLGIWSPSERHWTSFMKTFCCAVLMIAVVTCVLSSLLLSLLITVVTLFAPLTSLETARVNDFQVENLSNLWDPSRRSVFLVLMIVTSAKISWSISGCTRSKLSVWVVCSCWGFDRTMAQKTNWCFWELQQVLVGRPWSAGFSSVLMLCGFEDFLICVILLETST